MVFSSILDKTLFHTKYQKWAILVSICLMMVYLYSFVNYYGIYGDNVQFYENKRIYIISVIYLGIIALIWWKNTLSDKTNLILSVVWFCCTPFICYFILEFTQREWGMLSMTELPSLEIHLLNLGIYFFVACILLLLTGSLRISGIVSYVIFTGLGIAMFYVASIRRIPLIAADFLSAATAMNVAGSYDLNMRFASYFGLTLGIIGIVITAKLNGSLRLKWGKMRIIMITAALVLCVCIPNFYVNGDKMEQYYIQLWNPRIPYAQYGSIFGLVRSANYLVVEEPENYSPEEALQIAAQYMGDEGVDPSENEKPDIIMIMDESFSDLQNIGINSFETNEEVMPNINGLTENVQKAELYTAEIGGGTAGVEFEALTGNTNAFLPPGTMAYQTIISGESYSLASYFKSMKYQGNIAVHPARGTNYLRNEAYPLLGFERFIDINEFDGIIESKIIGCYVSDQKCFEKIIHEYEACKKLSDDPAFFFEVTMQNHAPYTDIEKMKNDIKIISDSFHNEVAQSYINFVHESDRALGDLIDYFEECEEPVLVAFFGDHPPTIEDDSFYKQLLGMDLNAEFTDEQSLQMRKTPLIIWANYDIEEKDLGKVSPNYISSLLTEAAGTPQTGYQKYLAELHKDIPVLNKLGYLDKDGNYYSIDDTNSPYFERINEYRILEYNNLIDTKNRIEGFFE